MKLIGIKGRMHSGKDTAVRFIREAAAPANVQRTAFADKMKLSGVRALGFDVTNVDEAVRIADIIKEQCSVGVLDSGGRPAKWASLDTPEIKTCQISGREFWQRYGTESHRDVFGDMFWVNALLPQPDSGTRFWQLEKKFPGVDVLCITDCRFPNEARRVRELGGQVWAIDADIRLGPLPEDAHVSEHPLPPELVTVTVPNNGSLDQFEYSIKTTWDLCRGK